VDDDGADVLRAGGGRGGGVCRVVDRGARSCGRHAHVLIAGVGSRDGTEFWRGDNGRASLDGVQTAGYGAVREIGSGSDGLERCCGADGDGPCVLCACGGGRGAVGRVVDRGAGRGDWRW